ncbi:hypothetical protein [Streptomyces sp. NPDC046909]|uniref:hypothetical protein n=1 Tax=Streptomyces sp. NPDC046909 TaxID=3155617 RepID=UPI00340043C7
MTDSSFGNNIRVDSALGGPAPNAGPQRRRKLLIGGGSVAVVALLVGGGVWWATSSGNDDSGQRVPVLPSTFAGYTEAKPHDTEWSGIGSESINTDITKGEVNLTYRASGGKALIIRARYEPGTLRPSDPSDPLYGIYNTKVDQKQVKTYSAGAVGGKIKCADVTIGATKFTTCGWHNDTTNVALAPMLNHSEIVSAEAPSYLRTFINSLQLTPQ